MRWLSAWITTIPRLRRSLPTHMADPAQEEQRRDPRQPPGPRPSHGPGRLGPAPSAPHHLVASCRKGDRPLTLTSWRRTRTATDAYAAPVEAATRVHARDDLVDRLGSDATGPLTVEVKAQRVDGATGERKRFSPVAGHRHPADRPVAGRPQGVQRARPVRHGLRLRLGRRYPPAHTAGGGEGRGPGRHGRARGRDQGADRDGRRLLRVLGLLGEPAAGLPAARHARPRPRRRRRSPGILERVERGLPRNPPPKVLGSHGGQLPRQPPESAQPAAKRAIQDIYNAEDKEHAAAAVKAFAK